MKKYYNKRKALILRSALLSLSLASTFTFISCAELFESRIGFDATMNNASLGNFVIPKIEITKLEAPSQIFVSQGEYSDTIKISWSAVANATYYRVERACATTKNPDGTFSIPDESEFEAVFPSKIYDTTTFVDRILKNNPNFSNEEYSYKYFYRVCAENPRLKYDSSDYIVSEGGSLLAPPNNVTSSLGEYKDKIIVSWEKVPNARGYDIYRSMNQDGSSPIKLSSVTPNQDFYTNLISVSEQGKEFYYIVRAVAENGTSVDSNIALGYGLQDGAPPKITDVKIVDKKGRGDTKNSISITWNPAAGADIKYSVYRTSSKDATYTQLATNLTTSSYEDTKSLKDNIYYYYQIQAYTEKSDGENSEKIKGPFSDSGSKSKTPAEGFILSPPPSISVSKKRSDKANCSIQFTAPIGSINFVDDSKLTTSYNKYDFVILGSDSKDSGFTEIKTVSDDLPKTQEGFYIIDTIAARKFYKIQTKSKVTNELSKESIACAPVPFEAQNLNATKAQFIEGYTNSDANANQLGVHVVKISWQPPEENDAEGGYYVYRSTKKESGFKRITDSPVYDLFYFDNNETAKAGTYYYYKVLSLNSLEQGNNYTNTEFGYGALTAEQYMREYNKTVLSSQKKLTLMHVPDDMKKLGSETKYGTLSGSIKYNASVAGLGARILMHYQDYADFYINNEKNDGFYFLITGDTNTSASMDASGTMDGTVQCTGMYNGAVVYDRIQIKGGGAAGGTYGIRREGFPNQIEVDWKIGEEGK